MLLLLIALTTPLCLDSFLISTVIGLARPPLATRLRLAALLAAFEAGMPLIGLSIGHSLASGLGSIAQYVAIGLLLVIGGYSAFRTRTEDRGKRNLGQLHGFTALALAFSISLDGLAIGFTYGLFKLPIILVTVLIGVQAFLFMQLGFAIGGHLPARVRRYGEQLANWVLVAIGVVLLVRKLTGGL